MTLPINSDAHAVADLEDSAKTAKGFWGAVLPARRRVQSPH